MSEFLNACPKLPMRNAAITKKFYQKNLQFELIGDYGNYLMFKKDTVEIHFFEFTDLNPLENYGQIYIRLNEIEIYYNQLINNNISIHPNGKLELKSWGQIEFAILDPDHNLITFGESR